MSSVLFVGESRRKPTWIQNMVHKVCYALRWYKIMAYKLGVAFVGFMFNALV